MKQITSVQNSYIKSLILLQEKSKIRKKLGLFLIEGIREIEMAVKGGFEINSLLFVPEICTLSNLKLSAFCNERIEISVEVYQKIAMRKSTEGIIAVAKSKSNNLDDLVLPENPLIIVIEAVEKPGNVGAILRTADAANVDAVLIANPKSDLYNPNTVRSSVGCLFTNQIATASSQEIIDFLKQKNIAIYSATLQNSTVYYTQDFSQPTALVVGSEATGLSEMWRTEANTNIIIPMEGKIDSMNVSVAAAILLFEAKRQRS